jgi:hypothetical protein
VRLARIIPVSPKDRNRAIIDRADVSDRVETVDVDGAVEG